MGLMPTATEFVPNMRARIHLLWSENELMLRRRQLRVWDVPGGGPRHLMRIRRGRQEKAAMARSPTKCLLGCALRDYTETSYCAS